MNGFVLTGEYMMDGGGSIMDYQGVEHTVLPVDIHGMAGELYLSADTSKTSHGLIWFDETNNVFFVISTYYEPDVILHIAENVKLVNPKK